MLMQGAVALANVLASSSPEQSVIPALLWFALSAIPLALAALAWRHTLDCRRHLDRSV
jgi:hypothetical protein